MIPVGVRTCRRASVRHDPGVRSAQPGVRSAQRARRPRCEISAIYFWQKLVFAPVGPRSDMIPESAQRALRSACAHAVGPQSGLSLECAQRARRPRCEISTIYFWQKLVFAPVGPRSDMIPESAQLSVCAGLAL